MRVKCLCWNCGREITDRDLSIEINEELWCSTCAAPAIGEQEDETRECAMPKL